MNQRGMQLERTRKRMIQEERRKNNRQKEKDSEVEIGKIERRRQ